MIKAQNAISLIRVDDGATPVKGTDYFTPTEIEEIEGNATAAAKGEILPVVDEVSEALTETVDGVNNNLTIEVNNRKAESIISEETRSRIKGNNPPNIAVVDIDNSGITIKKVDSNYSMKLSADCLSFLIDTYIAAQIITDNSLGSSLFADNIQLSTLRMRSAGGVGSLGWVAQTNGHLTLKEV